MINCPFDVLRPAVVAFDRTGNLFKRRQLHVIHGWHAAKIFGSLDDFDAAAGCGHMLDIFVGDFTARDFASYLRNDESVRSDFATDHGRTQAPRCFDGDH